MVVEHKSKRRRRMLKTVCLITGLLFMPCLVEQARGLWKLHLREAALLKRGEPISINDVLAASAEVRSPFDWGRLTAPLPTNLFVGEPISRTLMRSITPGKALALWNDPLWMASNRFVESVATAREALDPLHTALRHKPTSQSIDYHAGDEALIPHLRHVATLAECLAREALVRMDASDHAGVLQSIGSLGKLAASLEGELLLVCQAYRIRTLGVRNRLAWSALSMNEWTSAQMLLLLELLGEETGYAPFTRTLQMERAIWDQDFRKMASSRFADTFEGDSPPTYFIEPLHRLGFHLAWCRQDKWRSLHLFDHLLVAHEVGVADSSLSAAHARLRTDEPPGCTGVDDWYDGLRYRGAHVVQHSAIAHSSRALDQLYETEALRALVIAQLGIQLYQSEHRRLPESLATLWPFLALPEPLDALSGSSLRYRIERDGEFTLYSIGTDGVDDGGDQTDSYGRVPDGHFITSIWSLKDAVLPSPASVEQIPQWQSTSQE